MLIDMNEGQIRDCIDCLGFVAHDLEKSREGLCKWVFGEQLQRRAQRYNLTAHYLREQMDKERVK